MSPIEIANEITLRFAKEGGEVKRTPGQTSIEGLIADAIQTDRIRTLAPELLSHTVINCQTQTEFIVMGISKD